MLIYGAVLFGVRFPIQERVEAGVSYRDMLAEFGWGSVYIVSFLIIMGVSQVLKVFGVNPIEWRHALLYAIVPTVLFAIPVRSFGRPMFVFLTAGDVSAGHNGIGNRWLDSGHHGLGAAKQNAGHAVYRLHGFDHVRAAVLCRADRAPHFAAGAVGRLLRAGHGGPVVAGQRGHQRRRAVPGGHALRRRQDVLLADDAGRRFRAVSHAAAHCCSTRSAAWA